MQVRPIVANDSAITRADISQLSLKPKETMEATEMSNTEKPSMGDQSLLSFVFAREIQRIADEKLQLYVNHNQRHLTDACVIELKGYIIFKNALSQIIYLLLFEYQYLRMLRENGVGIITLYRTIKHPYRHFQRGNLNAP